MNGTDTRGSVRNGGWKRWFIGVLPAAALVAAVLAFRSTNPPAPVQAQAPVKSGPASKTSAAPGARTAAAGLQARPAATGGAAAPRFIPGAVGQASQKGAPKSPPPVKSLTVMAVVNGEQITRNDLARECLRRYGGEVLDNIINKQLLSEACAQRGIQITEKDVDDEVERIASKFGLPRDRWLGLLREERGFSEEQYEREVVWPMLALRRASQMSVQVTQDEIKKAFESEYGPKVRCRLIIVGKQEKAARLHAAAVANPQKFGQLAKEGEDASVASAHGVIPPIALHVGDPAIENAAFRLQKGQISEIIPAFKGTKFVILKCEDHLPEQYVSSKDLPAVQKALEDRIRDHKTRYEAANFFASVHKSAKIINTLTEPSRKREVPAGAAAVVNGRQVTLQQLQEECLVRFGGDVLDGEINRKLFTQELARRKVAVNEQDIQAEIARAADSNGYLTKDRKPDVERWIKDITTQDGATVDLYRSDVVWPTVALKKLCASRVSVSETDLQKGFESNYGERVEVLAIVVGDQRQAQRVWDAARNNPTDAYFAQLAQEYSIEPASKANGGKVPPVSKHSGSPIIEKAAFELQAGELSGIIAVEDQFIILRCQGRTEPVQGDIAAVQDELYKDIYEKKLRAEMNREFERLRDSAQIDNFLAGTSQAPKQRAAGPSASSVRPALDAKGSIAPASASLPRNPSPTRR